ncbi:hypothetical protein D3C73_1338000 [compost metagenome]
MARSTATVSAMAGLPKNWSTSRKVPAGAKMFPKVPPRMRIMGKPMARSTSPMDGSWPLASSASGTMRSSGTETMTRLPIQVPHKIPDANHAGIPQMRPMRMIQPRSTPNSPAAATGPGCGGRKACVTESPASNGRA